MKRIIPIALAVLVLLTFTGFPSSSVQAPSVRANELTLCPIGDDCGSGGGLGDDGGPGGPTNNLDTGDDDAFGDEIIMPHDDGGNPRHGAFEIILMTWFVMGGWI